MTTPASSAADALQDYAAVLALMTHSPLHRGWTVRDVLDGVLPPLMLGQYMLVREKSKAIAYASWAFVSDAAHETLLAETRALLPSEWRSGETVWFMDLIAPFGHGRGLAQTLVGHFASQGLGDKVAHWKRRYVKE